METKQLTYILAIAQEGGISKAATKLFITQSALSQQLLKLEHELGTPLFFRSNSGLSLTPAGRVYVEYARRVLKLKDEAYRIIHDLTSQQLRTFRLAFMPERGMEMFINIYPQFYAEYPQIKVVPQEINVRQQQDLLLEGKLDLGFITHQDKLMPGVEHIPLFREEFLLIAPQNHPLAKRAAPEGAPLAVVSPLDLNGIQLCLIDSQSTQREIIDPLMEDFGDKTALLLETASNQANISFVRCGLGCSILPAHYVEGIRGIARFHLSTRPSWTISACYPSSRQLPQYVQTFIRLAAEHFCQMK